MTKIALYTVLLICSLAMLLLVAGYISWQLGWPGLAAFLYPLAGNIMLLAFLLFLTLGCGLFIYALYQELAIYFRYEAMALRRVLVLQRLQQNAGQRLLIEKSQVNYLYELKRHRLLAANNKKHSRALFKAITVELQNSVAPDSFKSIQKHLKKHRNQANHQAMLALRDQVLCRSSIAG